MEIRTKSTSSNCQTGILRLLLHLCMEQHDNHFKTELRKFYQLY